MEKPKYKSKRELAIELGISKSTLYSQLKKKQIQTHPALISPKEENEIRIALGFPPMQEFDF